MSIPYIQVNSLSYATASSVLTLNTSYRYLRGGGSFSITGLPSILYYNALDSSRTAATYTFSISLSASTTYNLVFSFYKGVINAYPFDAGYYIGTTASPASPVTTVPSYGNGAFPINLGYVGPSTQFYETVRSINYRFNT